MNRQITRVAVVALGLLAALVVATTYWQTWAPPGLAARQDNAILRVAQFKIRRGLIYAADGRLLAARRAQKVDGQTFYFRHYPSGPLTTQSWPAFPRTTFALTSTPEMPGSVPMPSTPWMLTSSDATS